MFCNSAYAVFALGTLCCRFGYSASIPAVNGTANGLVAIVPAVNGSTDVPGLNASLTVSGLNSTLVDATTYWQAIDSAHSFIVQARPRSENVQLFLLTAGTTQGFLSPDLSTFTRWSLKAFYKLAGDPPRYRSLGLSNEPSGRWQITDDIPLSAYAYDHMQSNTFEAWGLYDPRIRQTPMEALYRLQNTRSQSAVPAVQRGPWSTFQLTEYSSLGTRVVMPHDLYYIFSTSGYGTGYVGMSSHKVFFRPGYAGSDGTNGTIGLDVEEMNVTALASGSTATS